ncbi:MAG: hypothetical protein HY907_19795 [Deltaproteobacteria bacterium]|nr:hypothetical protein [Deltaproteobacteria bacterium]
MRRATVPAVAATVLACLSCGGSSAGSGNAQDDAGTGGDIVIEDAAADEAPDNVDAEVGGEVGDGAEDGSGGDAWPEFLGDGAVLDAAGWEASEYVVLPPGSGCGDGVLDPGEQCDDWNRLDGDGCDWLCRLGDGEPPPAPDPDASDYVPSGELVTVSASPGPAGMERLPLAWTGSEFATAWFQRPERDGDIGFLRFRRFDSAGRPIDAEWRLPSVGDYGGLEVVWTGTGFGLFFVDGLTGLWYLRLDAAGKPIGGPVLIEGDVRARAPAADLAPDGTFVVAWMHDSGSGDGWSTCTPDGSPDLTRVRRVTIAGATPGPVFTVDETGQGFPDIAAGEDGFGMAVSVQVGHEEGFCSFRFLRLDDTLEHAAGSGVLGGYVWGDVKWIAADSRYVTAWAGEADESIGMESELRVAFFEPDGTLAGPPIRNSEGWPGWLTHRPVRVGAGDGGLALVTAFSGYSDERLSFLRTDRNGVAISPLRDLIEADPDGRPAHFGSYNTVWTDGGFAVLFVGAWPGSGVPPGGGDWLYLQHFVRAE